MGADHVLNAVRMQRGSKSLLLCRRHIPGIDDLVNFDEQISILLIKSNYSCEKFRFYIRLAFAGVTARQISPVVFGNRFTLLIVLLRSPNLLLFAILPALTFLSSFFFETAQ